MRARVASRPADRQLGRRRRRGRRRQAARHPLPDRVYDARRRPLQRQRLHTPVQCARDIRRRCVAGGVGHGAGHSARPRGMDGASGECGGRMRLAVTGFDRQTKQSRAEQSRAERAGGSAERYGSHAERLQSRNLARERGVALQTDRLVAMDVGGAHSRRRPSGSGRNVGTARLKPNVRGRSDAVPRCCAICT